ncbi:MAG: hypothetical protein AMXMBFR58_06510 [Phycisphaerae bacterium]
MLLAGGSRSAGQTLNLDAPLAPAPGTGEATLGLADRVDGQVQALERDRANAEGDASLELRIAIRVLARNLLQSGEQAGEPGSGQVIAGRTLALRLGALDLHLRAKATQLPAAVVQEIVRRCTIRPEQLPSDTRTLWRYLRDSLAPLVDATPPLVEGGLEDGGLGAELSRFRPLVPPHKSLADAARADGLWEDVIAACSALDGVLDTASAWPAYSRSAAMIRANASEAMWLLAGRPATGFSIEDRRVLGERFAAAAGLVCQPRPADSMPRENDPAEQGARTLRVMAAAARCIDLASRCEPRQGADTLRAALCRLAIGHDPVTNRPTDPSRDDSTIQRLSRAEALLRLLVPVSGKEFVASEDVVRQLRPAIKPLEESRRQGASELLEVLARAVVSPDVLRDPGFLAAGMSYQRRLEDLLLAGTVTRLLGHRPTRPNGAPGEWTLAPEFDAVGDRLLVLAKGLNSGREHDEALTQWRMTGAAARLLGALEGEELLRRAVQDDADMLAEHLRTVSGGRGGDLVARLEETRRAWLEEVRKARKIESAGLTRATRDLVIAASGATMAIDWAELRASLASSSPGTASGDAATVLGAWELSAEAASLLASIEVRSVATGIGLVADGKFDEFASDQWAPSDARVRWLVGDVSKAARRLGAQALTDSAADALRQLATGVPDPDREDPLGLRDELLIMSRYLEELARAAGEREEKLRAELQAYLGARAAAVRAHVERWR